MAVIVRSVPRAGAALSRALTAAGVPVELPPSGAPLAEQPAVRALLTVLDAPSPTDWTASSALSLLTGPIGRVDPVSLRQLRRALRRADRSRPPREFAELIVDASLASRRTPSVPGNLGDARCSGCAPCWSRRGAATADGLDPRYTLWQAWHRSGLQRRWLAASERGGPAGAQAERDLDAVTALFDVAEQYVTRTAGASLRGLVDHVASTWPPMRRSGRAAADSRSRRGVECARRARREWELVVIAGLQEGLWPNTIPRGGVLGTQQLIDVLDGIAAERHRPRAPLLAEERRLLIAAMGRARSTLLVTAVDSESGDDACCPRRSVTNSRNWPPKPNPMSASRSPHRGCWRPPRWSAGCARWSVPRPERLTMRHVHVPQHNWRDSPRPACRAPIRSSGTACEPMSTDEPLWSGEDHVVTLSPSTLQTLVDCPLRWLLERHGGSDGRDVRSAIGSLVHALVADSAKTEGQMLAELESLWEKLPFDSEWYADNELDRHRAMLSTFAQWRAQTRQELTEVGTEVDVDGVRRRARGRRRGTGARPCRPARARRRGPARRGRRQDRQEPGQQGRRATACPARDVSVGRSPKGLLPAGRRPGRRPAGLPRQDRRGGRRPSASRTR